MLCVSVCESPSPFSPCSERKQAGNVGGRATFFQSLEPADSCLVRPGAAVPLLGRTAATSWRIRWRPYACSRPQPEIKSGLTKKPLCLHSLSTCVNICGIPVQLHRVAERRDSQMCPLWWFKVHHKRPLLPVLITKVTWLTYRLSCNFEPHPDPWEII